MNKKILTVSLLTLAIALAIYFKNDFAEKDVVIQEQDQTLESNEIYLQQDVKYEEVQDKEGVVEEVVEDNINHQVPFIAQAPFGNWDDPIFQDACEEASVIMAMGWVKGIEKISPEDASNQIKDIAKFEDKNFGFNYNTNLEDVKKIFTQYFSYQKVEIKEDMKAEDIINELNKGSIVLIPAFGQALKNPNFTQPGPVAHMLVIKDYDEKTEEFITNDPGTKRGESYRYKKNVLFDAIWQYPSGKDKLGIPQGNNMQKGMIIISK